MAFAHKKTRKLRLSLLNDQRAERIRKLIERGLIESEKENDLPVTLNDLECRGNAGNFIKSPATSGCLRLHDPSYNKP